MRTHAEEGRTRGTWVELLKEGDQEAWEAFLPRYAGFLVALFHRRGLGVDDWEDVQAEILLTLFQKIKQYIHNPLEPSFRCWLAAVIHSRVMDQHRKNGRRLCRLTEEQLNRFCEQAAEEGQRLAAEDWREQKLAEVLRIVQKIAPPGEWDVFRRRWLERQSIEEVARALQHPPATVMVYTSKVLALCKQEARKVNLQW